MREQEEVLKKSDFTEVPTAKVCYGCYFRVPTTGKCMNKYFGCDASFGYVYHKQEPTR